jgi:hypothetical protein
MGTQIAEGSRVKTKNYVVGKGRPPARSRWKPGQSGNPKGRRKGVKNMTTYFDEALSRKIDVKVGGKMRRMSVREAIAMNATNLALKGDIKMIPLMLGKNARSALWCNARRSSLSKKTPRRRRR